MNSPRSGRQGNEQLSGRTNGYNNSMNNRPPTPVPTISEKIQPIYLAQAEVFIYDPDAATQWTPKTKSTVPTSILFDSTRGIYRIISVDTDCQRVLINSTVYSDLTFHKISLKFGHWTDKATEDVHGIGFASEYELDSFYECLKNVKIAVRGLENESLYTTISTESTKGTLGCTEASFPNNYTFQPQHGQGEGRAFMQVPDQCTLPSWDHNPKGQNLAGLLNQVDRTHPLPQASFRAGSDWKKLNYSPQTSPRLEALKVKAPIDLPPAQYQHYFNDQKHSNRNKTKNHQQSSPRIIDSTTRTNTGRDDNHPGGFSTRDLTSEIQQLKTENQHLTTTLVDSSTNVKKWEAQINTLKADNAQLQKTLDDLSAQVEDATQEATACHEQLNILRVESEGLKETLYRVKDLEDKVSALTAEKVECLRTIRQLEAIVINLQAQQESWEEEKASRSRSMRSSNQYNSTSSNNRSAPMINTNSELGTDAQEVLQFYNALLRDTQKKLDEALRANREGRTSVQKVDLLFTNTIDELIKMHDQLRMNFYENDHNDDGGGQRNCQRERGHHQGQGNDPRQ